MVISTGGVSVIISKSESFSKPFMLNCNYRWIQVELIIHTIVYRFQGMSLIKKVNCGKRRKKTSVMTSILQFRSIGFSFIQRVVTPNLVNTIRQSKILSLPPIIETDWDILTALTANIAFRKHKHALIQSELNCVHFTPLGMRKKNNWLHIETRAQRMNWILIRYKNNKKIILR